MARGCDGSEAGARLRGIYRTKQSPIFLPDFLRSRIHVSVCALICVVGGWPSGTEERVIQPVSNEEIISLALDEIDGERRAEVAGRIAASPDASRTLAAVTIAVQTMRADDSISPPGEVVQRVLGLMRSGVRVRTSLMDVAGQVAEQVREFLCTLVRDTQSEPALAGFRGTTESRHLSFECEIAEIDVQVSRGEGEARRTIRGQVASLTDDTVGRIAWRSTLTGAAEREIAADESGVFVLECPVGVYELSARVGGSVVRIPPISVA